MTNAGAGRTAGTADEIQLVIASTIALPDAGRTNWWAQTRPQGVSTAAREVVDLAAEVSGLRTWYIGRFAGSAVLPIAVSQGAAGVQTGRPINWSESICRRMVTRLGPCLAEDIDLVPNYARAPGAIKVQARSYAGVPLLSSSDRLLGLMAGWDTVEPAGFPPHLENTLWTLARLFTPLLEEAISRDAERRAADQAAARARTAEILTRLPGRRGWGQVLDAEELRAAEHGHPLGILVIDAGNLRSTTEVQAACKHVEDALPSHVVARLSPRQIGVLVIGEDVYHLEGLVKTALEPLRRSGFNATAGSAARIETPRLRDMWMLAEERLTAVRRAEAAATAAAAAVPSGPGAGR